MADRIVSQPHAVTFDDAESDGAIKSHQARVGSDGVEQPARKPVTPPKS